MVQVLIAPFQCIGNKLDCFSILGVYVLYFDEGPMSKNFLEPPCYFVIIFGVTITLTSYLGHLGLHYRIVKGTTSMYSRPALARLNFCKGNLSAFKILCVYIFTLLVLFAGEVVALNYAYNLNSTLQSSLREGDVPYPILRGVEIYISKFFNEFFFDNTISQCNSVPNTVFWGFVDDYCPAEIHEDRCQKCFP